MRVSVDRLNGYLDTMRKNNLNIADGFVQYSTAGYESGYDIMKSIMQLNDPPTAVFCNDDAIASKAILAALDMGVRVPEDVSIMGFDNQRLLPDGYKGPDISSMAQPLYDIGRESIEILAKQLDDGNGTEKVTVVYNTYLVEGGTVKRR